MNKKDCWAVLLYDPKIKRSKVLGFVQCQQDSGSPNAQLAMFNQWPESKTNRNYFVRPAWESASTYYKRTVPLVLEKK